MAANGKGHHPMTDTPHYNEMSPGDFLQAVGMDGKKWAEAFKQMFPESDEGLMRGWFSNAIMAGYDEAIRRTAKALANPALLEAVAEAAFNAANCNDDYRSAPYAQQVKQTREYWNAAVQAALSVIRTWAGIK